MKNEQKLSLKRSQEKLMVVSARRRALDFLVLDTYMVPYSRHLPDPWWQKGEVQITVNPAHLAYLLQYSKGAQTFSIQQFDPPSKTAVYMLTSGMNMCMHFKVLLIKGTCHYGDWSFQILIINNWINILNDCQLDLAS